MRLDGMHEAELRRHSVCTLCGSKIMKQGIPTFWRLRIERHAIEADAVRRQTGLAVFMVSAGIAAVLGPDERMTRILRDEKSVAVCESCAGEKLYDLLIGMEDKK